MCGNLLFVVVVCPLCFMGGFPFSHQTSFRVDIDCAESGRYYSNYTACTASVTDAVAVRFYEQPYSGCA